MLSYIIYESMQISMNCIFEESLMYWNVGVSPLDQNRASGIFNFLKYFILISNFRQLFISVEVKFNVL